jgi:hypothetical protein
MTDNLQNLLAKIDPKIKESIIKVLELEFTPKPVAEVLTQEQLDKIKQEELQAQKDWEVAMKPFQSENFLIDYATISTNLKFIDEKGETISTILQPSQRGQLYYPELSKAIKIDSRIYKAGEKIDMALDEYVWLSEEDWITQKREELLKFNSEMKDHPVFLKQARIYVDYKDVDQATSLFGLYTKLSEKEQSEILQKAKNEGLEFVLANQYLPAVFGLKTGVQKIFNLEYSGAVQNGNIGQFKML